MNTHLSSSLVTKNVPGMIWGWLADRYTFKVSFSPLNAGCRIDTFQASSLEEERERQRQRERLWYDLGMRGMTAMLLN